MTGVAGWEHHSPAPVSSPRSVPTARPARTTTAWWCRSRRDKHSRALSHPLVRHRRACPSHPHLVLRTVGGCHQRADLGTARGHETKQQDVGGRDKPGHDGRGRDWRLRHLAKYQSLGPNAPAGAPETGAHGGSDAETGLRCRRHLHRPRRGRRRRAAALQGGDHAGRPDPRRHCGDRARRRRLAGRDAGAFSAGSRPSSTAPRAPSTPSSPARRRGRPS